MWSTIRQIDFFSIFKFSFFDFSFNEGDVTIWIRAGIAVVDGGDGMETGARVGVDVDAVISGSIESGKIEFLSGLK